MLFVFAPGVRAAKVECGEQKEKSEGKRDGNPERGRRDAIFNFLRGVLLFNELRVGVVSQVVLGEKGFFIETKIAGDGADKTAVENATGEFVPILVFEGFQKTGTDARRQCDFFQRHLAQFTFAF